MKKILFLILFLTTHVLAQDINSEIFKMMEAARRSLQQMDESFGEFKQMSFDSGVKYQHMKEKGGHSVVFELPKDPNIKLDLDIQEQYIIVKVQSKTRFGVSQRTETVQIPYGVDFERPKIIQKDGKLFVKFKFKDDKTI